MTSRTVMAARIGPASHRRGSRTVYICAPGTRASKSATGPLIEAALKDIVRIDDRLLYPSYPGSETSADSVVAFAAKHHLLATSIADASTAPDLVIVIVDPTGDNAALSPARVLAIPQNTDLIITELPTILG